MSAGALFDLEEEDVIAVTLPPVTTTQLVMYAGASGDYNRIHYDQAYAIESGLGGVVAHGMLTMGLMARALSMWGGPQSQVVRMAVRFMALVRPGDQVEVIAKVKKGHTDPGARDGNIRQCELTAAVAGRIVAAGQATIRKGGPQ